MNKISKRYFPDKAVLSIMVNRMWSVIKGPITTVFQILFLTQKQQGIWYTFMSLGALASLAEMGFTTIITQFVSHEATYVTYDQEGLHGEVKYINKIVSLIRYAIKVYMFIIPIVILLLATIGLFFFNGESIYIKFSWILFSISGGINLFVSLLQSIYLGLDKVITVQKNILIGSLITTIMNWILLYLGFNVMTLAIGNFIGAGISIFLLYRCAPAFWKTLMSYQLGEKYNWYHEIINLQTRYAISFFSGYFAIQFFTPVIYKNHGDILSGQFGMVLTIITMVSNMSYAFIDAKIPYMNTLAEKKEYNDLWKLFRKLLIQSAILAIIGFILMMLCLLLISPIPSLANRFLSPITTGFILLFQLVNFYLGSVAKCIRVFKIEPFVNVSVFIASCTVFILLVLYPVLGLELSLLCIDGIYIIFVLPYTYYVYKKYRKIYV